MMTRHGCFKHRVVAIPSFVGHGKVTRMHTGCLTGHFQWSAPKKQELRSAHQYINAANHITILNAKIFERLRIFKKLKICS